MRTQVQKHRHNPYCTLSAVTRPGPFHPFIMAPIGNPLHVAWKDAGANSQNTQGLQGLVFPPACGSQQPGSKAWLFWALGAVEAEWLHVDQKNTPSSPSHFRRAFCGPFREYNPGFSYHFCRVTQERWRWWVKHDLSKYREGVCGSLNTGEYYLLHSLTVWREGKSSSVFRNKCVLTKVSSW